MADTLIRYVWCEDIRALTHDEAELFAQLDGALSMQVHQAFLDPFLRRLHIWLRDRCEAQQADLPPERRGGKFTVQVRGDDMLEGMCIAACKNEQAGSMDDRMTEHFLKHVRPPWKLICAVKEL